MIGVRRGRGGDDQAEDCEGKERSEELNDEEYGMSGMSSRLVSFLMGRQGRDALLDLVRKFREGGGGGKEEDDDGGGGGEGGGEAADRCFHRATAPSPPLATKESLRRSLHAVQRYHKRASPTRGTMKKLHRFFMSAGFDEEEEEEEEKGRG